MHCLFGTKNLQLRGRIWWVKKMIHGVLVHRSLETTDRDEALRRMPAVIQAGLQMRQFQRLSCRVGKQIQANRSLNDLAE